MPLYEPLPEDSVRLLRLLPPSDSREGIDSQLFTCPLLKSGSTHNYEALSYVWGPEDNQQSIRINNCKVFIRANLYEALLCLQDRFLERILWIDAVCINQEDKDEKGHQVQSMAKIYARASRVIAWLGEVADQSNEALEAIRVATEGQSMDSATNEAIVKLLSRSWFKRIWVLQEVAAARHILIKSGRTEIDGFAFCLGLNALEISYGLNQSLGHIIPAIAYLIRGAVFRPRYEGGETSQPEMFALNHPLSQLVDMYHTRQATDRRDKIYALLGMTSDASGDLDNAGLSPNYQMPWKEVFRNLVKFSTSDEMSVTVWNDKEVAVIQGKGCLLGRVSHVERHHARDDIQSVKLLWIKPFYQKGNRESRLDFPASAKTIQTGDAVYLQQGARLPSIVRPYGSHLAVIVITIPIPKYTQSITTFWHETPLVWDWEAPRGKAQDETYFEGLIASWRKPKCPSTECKCQDFLHEATKIWDMGLILNGLERHEEAVKTLQKAVEIYGIALKVANISHGPWANSYNEVLSVMDDIITKEQGADIESQGMERRTTLSWAAGSGHESFVRLLLDMGSDVDATDDVFRTPLFHAVENGHEAIIWLLLDKGADIEESDAYCRTPLCQAAVNGHEAIIRLLLDKGADIEESDAYCRTPLCQAAANGHEAISRLLLDRGAAIDTHGSETPLSQAAANGHETVVRLLLDRGAAIDAHGSETPLSQAAKYGHETVVRLLLDMGGDIEKKDLIGKTPLFHAVQNGREAITQLLLERGADIHASDKLGGTPLCQAAANGHEALVRLLLDKGTHVDAGCPLVQAAKYGHKAIVQLLVEKGAAIDYKLIQWASENEHEAIDIVKLLRDNGAKG